MSQFLRTLDTGKRPFPTSFDEDESSVRPAKLLPQNGHATANAAPPPWHLE